MERLEFNDYEEFACEVVDTYDSLDHDDEEDVAIISKYDESRQIIKELLCLGYDIHSVEIHDDLWESYDAEYVISLYENEVWCEPMLRENGYIDEDAPVIYVLDNCSSKVIPYCKGKTVYEVSVGDDDCSCDDCEEGFTVNGKPVSKEEFDKYVSQFRHDEKPTTTSSTKSVYKVNGKECTKEEFDKKYEKFEEMYLDNIRDMFLNDWQSRFLRW